MIKQERLRQIEGVVRASNYRFDESGKLFLGVIIECSDQMDWVISYDEQSPFRLFADRQVLASGEPYEPKGQKLIGRRGKTSDQLGHFRASTVRLLDVAADAPFVEVRSEQKLWGRFARGLSATGASTLFFITQRGDTFLVVNDPIGMKVGCKVEVSAYQVQESPSNSGPLRQYLWVICPHTFEDLWEWRNRRK